MTEGLPTVGRGWFCIRLAPTARAPGRPTFPSFCFLVRALLFEHSGPTNLVSEHPVKDAFLYDMSPDIPRTPPTAICSLESDVGIISESKIGYTLTRLRGGSSSSILGDAKGREMISLVDLTRRIFPDPPRPDESFRGHWRPQRLLHLSCCGDIPQSALPEASCRQTF